MIVMIILILLTIDILKNDNPYSIETTKKQEVNHESNSDDLKIPTHYNNENLSLVGRF
jgi:hypothetical protein